MEKDPDELTDVWDSPDYTEVKVKLRRDLSEWFVTSTVNATGWWKDPAAKATK